MSRSSWRASLKRALKRLTENDPGFRVAILGLGSEEWGDDAAGIAAARRLKRCLSRLENILVIEAGVMPENFTGLLRRFSPGFVLLIDAARDGVEPGTICWIDFYDLDGISAFSHGLPLSVQAEYLRNELGCEVGLIGIGGASFNFGEPVSPPVRRALDNLVRASTAILKQFFQNL